MKAPNVFVIVLNYNQEKETAECLQRLLAQSYDPFEVLVVDNGSRTNPRELLGGRFPKVQWLLLPENVGFSAGCNRGMERALSQGADAFVLLNNDAVVQPDFLKQMVETAYSDPRIGVVGAVIYRLTDLKHPFLAGMRFDFFRGRIFRILPNGRDVPSVSGSCFFLKRDLFERISPLDERFFIYFEETDFCYRAHQKGFRIVYDPRVGVCHEDGSTFGRESSAWRYLYTRNRLLFLSKHCPRWLRPWSFFIRLLQDGGHLLFFLLKGEKEMSRAVFYGITDYVKGRFGKGRLGVFFHG